MLALGLGLRKEVFTEIMRSGQHQMIPSGSDLSTLETETIISSFRYGKALDGEVMPRRDFINC